VRLVVFDLDGTITYRDTLWPYATGWLKRSHRSRLRMARMLPTVAAFGVGLADHGAVKSAFIRCTLGGARRADLSAWSDEFVPWVIGHHCSAGALEAVRAHREAGDHLVMMSASTDLYVPQIGRALGFDEIICTGVAFDPSGRLDGALTTPNRRGIEKARCFAGLRERFPDLQSVAYGNAASDLPHLKLADVPRLVNPSPRTRRKAARQGIRPFADWNP
jgi:phosphatidylglycerophosphatase C